MRKFRVKADLQKHSEHNAPNKAEKKKGGEVVSSEARGLHREIEILANDPDDAKIRAKHLLADEGYEERVLHRAMWTVLRLDRRRKTRD